MGFWEVVTGRRRTAAPDLDVLFEVPSAAVLLQTGLGLAPTGVGSVCYRPAGGQAFRQAEGEVLELLRADADAPEVTVTTDGYGFSWLTVHGDPGDVGGLCTDLHAVNTALVGGGFGSGLLCTLVPFGSPDGRRVGLVHLHQQGTFYPFAPTGPQQRDNLLELQLRDVLAAELPMEKDLSRWLALWDAPGL